NLRKASSLEPSPCRRKTPASEARFRAALPHVIQPRRVSTATDPPVALRMRPVTSSLCRPTHRPQAALSAADPFRPRPVPVSPLGTPPVPSGPLRKHGELLVPAPECQRLDGLSSRLFQAEILPASIDAPALHDLRVW
ncbi:keratinocyte proline-rich protein, partial [Trichinella spiralis]|uniref:keratinocyte proline-rich protein n=3 Tax=Trichinella spiralis TaxID=6334 RepID=UPI0001EFEFD3